MEAKWTRSEEEFISVVKRYPVLYKPTKHPRSKVNLRATSEAWRDISVEMKFYGHTISNRSCRDKFRQILQRYELCIEKSEVDKSVLGLKYLDGKLEFLRKYVNKKNGRLYKKQSSKDIKQSSKDNKQSSKEKKEMKNNSTASFEFPPISLLSSDSDSESTETIHSKGANKKNDLKLMETPTSKTIVSLDMIEALLKSRKASSNAGTVGLIADAVGPEVSHNNVDAAVHLSKTYPMIVEPGNVDKHSVANNFAIMQNPDSTNVSASFPNAQWSGGNVENVFRPIETRTSESTVSLDMISALLKRNNDSSKSGNGGVLAEAGGLTLETNNRSIKYATSTHLSETLPLLVQPRNVNPPSVAKANMNPHASTSIMMPLHLNTIANSHVNATICNYTIITEKEIGSKIDPAKANMSPDATTSVIMPLYANTITSSRANATICNHTNFTGEAIYSRVDSIKANMSPDATTSLIMPLHSNAITSSHVNATICNYSTNFTEEEFDSKIDPTCNEFSKNKALVGNSVKKEITSLFDINSDGDDIAVFLNEVADYVSNSYSLEKQRNIRSKICELVFAAEIQEIDHQ